MATIYALVDSLAPAHYRYIGKTEKSPDHRLYHHLYRVKRDRNLYKSRWIEKVLRGGGAVEIVTLEQCNDVDQNTREIYWIAKARLDGHSLTNMSDGGEGGINPVPEVRARIAAALRGRKRPPHVIEALRTNGKKYVGVANPNFGKCHTQESRAKISAAHKGRILTQEHRDKLSISGKGKNAGECSGRSTLSEIQVREIYRQKVSMGRKNADIAREFGIHPMTIYKITNGSRWPHLRLTD